MSCDGPASICRQCIESLYQSFKLRDTRRWIRRSTARVLSWDRERAVRFRGLPISSAPSTRTSGAGSTRRRRASTPVRGLPAAAALLRGASGYHRAWLVWLRKPRGGKLDASRRKTFTVKGD